MACALLGLSGMATTMHPRHLEPTTSFEGIKISWGGIWGGVLTAMGILLLMTSLGVAIGVSAVDPRDTDASAFGTAAAIWTGLSLLVALFVGGMAATRLGMIFDRAAGAFEGALVWVLSVLVILYLASTGVRLVASGVAGLLGGVSQTVIGPAAAGLDDIGSGDVNQISARLRDPETARTISAATGIPQEQVASTLGQIDQRVQAARNDPAAVAAEVRRGTGELMAQAQQRLPEIAAQAQDEASATAWITFIAMAISLLAAIVGATVGRRQVVGRLMSTDTAPAGVRS